MSFKALLASQATIWNVTQSTAFGISESTSFSAQVNCRIRARTGTEEMVDERETNLGSHIIYLESTNIDTTMQLVSEDTIYHINDVREVYGRKTKHHLVLDAEAVK